MTLPRPASTHPSLKCWGRFRGRGAHRPGLPRSGVVELAAVSHVVPRGPRGENGSFAVRAGRRWAPPHPVSLREPGR
jgi:hypothetical protein